MDGTSQWEYRVESMGGALRNPRDEELQSALNEWGEEGWEVIFVIQYSGTNKVRVIAKRPLTERARRSRSMPS